MRAREAEREAREAEREVREAEREAREAEREAREGQGTFLSSNFPRKIVLTIDNKTVPVNYAVRACKPIAMPPNIQSPHKLMIHGSTKGCKGWRPEVALGLSPIHRICECDAEAAKRRERNESRKIAPHPKSAHEALGKAPPKPCARFTQGLCLRNKRGVRCNLSHAIPGAWIDNKCTIRCLPCLSHARLAGHGGRPKSPVCLATRDRQGGSQLEGRPSAGVGRGSADRGPGPRRVWAKLMSALPLPEGRG